MNRHARRLVDGQQVLVLEQNRKLAQESIIGEIVRKQRRKDMSLYKNYAEDLDFRKSVEQSIIRILALHKKSKPA